MLSVVHDLKDPHMGNNMILKLGSHSFHIPALPPLFFNGTLESGRLAFLPQVSEEGRGWERVEGWRSRPLWLGMPFAFSRLPSQPQNILNTLNFGKF